jgi:RHS repeat-associated protein
VVNTIQYQPYQGAMKGPMAVLETGEGNDWDTDSLLVGLFSAAGISGLQYVTTQIVEPILTVENWLGVQSPYAAYNVLTNAGLRPTTLSSVSPWTTADPSSPTVQFVQFDHVWLEGTIGGQSVFLDPSWKIRDFQPGIPGIAANVSMDTAASNFLTLAASSPSIKELAYEYYEDQVRAYLANPANNLTNKTIADVPYTGPIHPQVITTLPSSPTYYGYQASETRYPSTSIPAQYEYFVQITEAVKSDSNTVSSAVYNALENTTTITVSDTPFNSTLLGTPLVIYETSGEQAFTITSYVSTSQVVVSGNASGTSGDNFAISVVSYKTDLPDVSLRRLTVFTGTTSAAPHIYLDGSDSVTPPSALPSGTSTVNLVIQVFAAASPSDSFSGAGLSQSYAHVYDRGVNKYLGIGLDANQTSPEMLANIRSVVNQANINQADNSSWWNANAANEDQLFGGMLQLAVAEYFNENDTGENEIDGLTQAVPYYNYVASGIATCDPALQTGIPANTQNELEIPYLPQNMVIDVPDNCWSSLSITNDTSHDTTRFNLEGLTNSSMEANIWDELSRTPSLSTTTSMQFASETSIGTSTISDPSQINNYLGNMVSTNTSSTEDLRTAVRNSIVGYLNQSNSTTDYRVVVPNKETPVGRDVDGNIINVTTSGYDLTHVKDGWVGVGYILESSPHGQNTWSYYGFVIQGYSVVNYNAVGTIGEPHGGVVPPIYPEYTDIPPLSSNQFNLGDPINTANGDVISDATDFSTPNLGSPLDIARHYHSIDTAASGQSVTTDRGMGDGWSFTYSDTLTTSTDPNDPSGTKIWLTDTGVSLKFKKQSGVFQTPNTMFGTLVYNGTGLGYTWTDETGSTVNFNDSGYITSALDRYGDGVAISYVDSTSKIDKVQRVLNNVTQTSDCYLKFTYNSDTVAHITAITYYSSTSDTTGRTWTYGYDSALYGDSSTRLISATGPITGTDRLSMTQYAYWPDAAARHDLLKSVTDANGNTTQFTYYANRRGFQVTDANGNTHSISYNLDRSRTSYTDERGQITYYTFDGHGNTTELVGPDRTATFSTYSTGDLKLSDTDAYGQTESYVYNDTNNPVAKNDVTQFTDRAGNVTDYVYTDYSQPFTVTRESDGGTTHYYYYTTAFQQNTSREQHGTDAYLWEVVDADNDTTTYTYPGEGSNPGTMRSEPTSVTAPNGNVSGHQGYYTTWFEYNDSGQVTAQYSPVATTSSTRPTSSTYASLGYTRQTFSFDGAGDLTASTDGKGSTPGDPAHTTTYGYDIYGHRTSQTLPAPDAGSSLPALVTVYVYDADGNLISTTLATASPQETMSTVYDSMGRPVESINPDGTYATDVYDTVGNLIYQADAMGRVTRFVYDSRGRQVATIRPDGTVVTTAYDGGGRVVATTDALENTTRFVYDTLGRQIEEIAPYANAAGAPTIDDSGAMSPGTSGTFTKPTGSWSTAPAGSGGFDSQYSDASGSASAKWAFTNLAAGWYEVFVTWPAFSNNTTAAQFAVSDDGTSRGSVTVNEQVTPPPNATFTDAAWLSLGLFYAASGTLNVTLTNGDSNYLVADAVRIVQVTPTLTHYDDVNDVQCVTNGQGLNYLDTSHTSETDYDKLGHTIKVIQPAPASGQSQPTTYYHYDASGNLQWVTDARGASAGDSAHTTNYVYDESNRKTEQILPDPNGGSNTLTTQYFYDSNSNLQYVVNAADPSHTSTSYQDLAYTTQYVYDNLNRKTKVISPRTDGVGSAQPQTLWQYDQNGNLVSTTDPNGNVTRLAYNIDGEPTQATDVLGETTTTTYDAVGNILSVTNALGATTFYLYDSMNRKVAKISPVPLAGQGQSVRVIPVLGLGQVICAGGPTTTWQYDFNSNVTTATDPLGNPTWTQYNGWNLPVAVTDADDGTTTTTYDPLGRVSTVTDPLGRTTQYVYDDLGRKTAEVDPAAITTLDNGTQSSSPISPTTYFGYDAVGNLKYTTDPRGATDAGGQGAGDPNYTTWYFYDDLNRQVCAIEPGSTSVTWTTSTIPDTISLSPQPNKSTVTSYDALGDVLTTTDELGRITRYQYDNLGRQTATIAPYADTTKAITNDDVVGSGFSLTPTTGGWSTVSGGYGGQYHYASGSSNVATWTFSQSQNSNFVPGAYYEVLVTWVGNSANSTAAPYTIYDGMTSGTVRGTVNVNQTVSPPANPVFTDAGWQSLGFFWISGSTLTVTLTGVDGGSGPRVVADAVKIIEVSPTTSTFDLNGNALSTTDADDHTSYTVYDALSRPVKSVSALGSGPSDPHFATLATFDAAGNTMSVTDPDGNVTSYSYDRLNRQIQVADPLRNTSSTVYDAAGDAIQATDRDGRVTQYVYDPVGQQVQENWLDANGSVYHSIQTSYDGAGEVVGITETDITTSLHTADPTAGARYEYAYDQDGRVIASGMAPNDMPQSAVTLTGWSNPSGSLPVNSGGVNYYEVYYTLPSVSMNTVLTITLTSSQFDAYLILQSPTGRTVVVDDDGGGGTNAYLQVPVDESGQWTVYVAESPKAGVLAAGTYTLTVSAKTFGPLVTMTYGYDAAGNVTSTAETSTASNDPAATISQQYDALSRLTQIKQALNGTVNERVDLAYYTDGSLNTVNRYADDGTTSVATSTDSYDGMGRLTSLAHSSGYFWSGYVAPGYTFQYDPAGNMTSMTSAIDNASGAATTFNNDATGQLTSAAYNSTGNTLGGVGAVNESYTLDANGNRLASTSASSSTQTGWQTGAANRLLWDGTYTYCYDAEGNRLMQTVGTSGATTRYTWDQRNRLVQVAYYNSLSDAQAQQSATETVKYTYDAFNQRVEETVTISGSTTYDYLVDDGGGKPFMEFTSTSGLATSTPLVTDIYLNAPALGQTFADDQLATNTRVLGGTPSGLATLTGYAGPVWILPNQVGTANDLMWYSGGTWLVTHRVFNAFGAAEQTAVANYYVGTNVAYAGMFMDPNTGLSDDWNRWYDANVGQFIVPDPSGFSAGDMNTYRYVFNAPEVATDPSGLGSSYTVSSSYGSYSLPGGFSVGGLGGLDLYPSYIVGQSYSSLGSAGFPSFSYSTIPTTLSQPSAVAQSGPSVAEQALGMALRPLGSYAVPASGLATAPAASGSGSNLVSLATAQAGASWPTALAEATAPQFPGGGTSQGQMSIGTAGGPTQSATLNNIEAETGRANGAGLGWGHPTWPAVSDSGAAGSYDVSSANGNVSVTSDVRIWGTATPNALGAAMGVGNAGVCNTAIPGFPFNNGGEYNVYLKNQPPGVYEVVLNYSSMLFNTANTGGPHWTMEFSPNTITTAMPDRLEPLNLPPTALVTQMPTQSNKGGSWKSNTVTATVRVPDSGQPVRIFNYKPTMAITSQDMAPNPMSRATTNVTIQSVRRIGD